MQTVLMIFVLAVAGLQLWRLADGRKDDAAWARLARSRVVMPERFHPRMLAGLPEPAVRFFRFAIAPDTLLSAVVEIEMCGEVGLGTKEAPRYQPMRAHQILAAPEGLVWRLSAGRAPVHISGSDGIIDDGSWVRFWLLDLFPVVRAGGNADHLRAAFGRVVAEAAIWTPAALLPQTGTTWEAVAADAVRATVRHRGLIQSVEIHVDAEGRPLSVVIPRWTNANPSGEYRI